MKLTVLGCWAPYPRAGGACSGYLLQSGGKNILLECGNGVISNLQLYIDFRSLDAVIISHLHPDHYLDLFCLRHAVGGARRLRPELHLLPLYMPDNPVETFDKMAGYKEAFAVTAIERLPGLQKNGSDIHEVVIGSNKISFIKTDHQLPTYAVLVEGEGKLFYSADTKWAEYLSTFAQGSDVILCEASVTEEDREYTSVGHLTCREAGEFAKIAGAGRLVATHLWPEYNLDTIQSEVDAGFGRSVTLAREGLEVLIK